MTAPQAHHREERLHALDHLRATAMMLGIVLHGAASFFTTPVPWIVHDSEAALGFDVLGGVIHGFRMQLFFFLAGFFGRMLRIRLGARAFLIQRLTRIGVPFVAGMVTLVPLMFAITRWSESQVSADPTWDKTTPLTFLTVPTCHLWFLEVLLILYVGAVILGSVPASAWLPRLDAAFDTAVARPWRVLVPLLPTALCLWNGPRLGDPEDFGMTMLPSVRGLLYCGLFFAAGWWMHRRRHQITALQRWPRTSAVLAILSFTILGVCHLALRNGTMTNHLAVTAVGVVAAAIYAWAMVFFTTGVFLRFAGQHRPWMRYLADASYGCYLVHLPLVLWLQVIVSKWPLWGVVKLALIVVAATAGSLLCYELTMRRTWIGAILTGKRRHRG